jgi:hypothetical protein
MRKATIAVLILGVVALSGCAQTGTFTAGNLTTVELSEPNYEVVATGVSGTAKAGYLIGASFSDGAKSGPISLFRVSGTGHLYKEAMEGLWAFESKQHGPAAGRRLALINIRYDADTRNFLVYNDIAVSLRADVVEFTDD